MSKNGKKKHARNQGTPLPQPAVPNSIPVPIVQPSIPNAEKPARKRLAPNEVAQWAFILFNLALSAVTLYLQHESNKLNAAQSKISQRAEDRASGKLKAKFEFVGVGNTDEKKVARFTKKTLRGFEAIYLDDVDSLVHWGPYVEIKNTGDEVIDSIQVDVDFDIGAVFGEGVTQKTPVPYIVNQPSIIHPTLSAKLSPGQSARVSLIKPLLEQLVAVKMDWFPKGDECVGVFKIRTSCRIVGTTVYDEPSPPKTVKLFFAWLRSGFGGEQCKKILEMQERVIVDEK